MKAHLIILIGMFLSCINGYSTNNSSIEFSEKPEHQVQLDQYDDYKNVYLGDIKEKIHSDFSCTRSVKIYVPTTAGVIGFGLSITADTCEEADAGLAEAVRGFVNEVM